MSMARIRTLSLAWLVVAACLSGCTGTDHDELQAWMTAQRNQAKPKIQPISEPKKFRPQTYNQDKLMEPFNAQKLTVALRRESGQTNANAGLIEPELRRRKEPLEAFPLDSVTLVGSMLMAGQPVALVRVDTLVYQAKVGSYLGQNYGRITKVTESELVLREIVQDAAGEWIERVATLQLQERTK